MNGLEFVNTCRCAGTGCGGHLTLSMAGFNPVGYQGAAQHTYTRACDGFHEPGPCPPQQKTVWVQVGSRGHSRVLRCFRNRPALSSP